MPDVDDLLERLENEEDPREALREAESVFESGGLSGEDRSRLAYGIAAGYFRIEIFGDALDWLEETDADRRWMLKGFCHLNLDQHGTAREAFLKAARENPGEARGSLLLAAQCLAYQGSYDAAVEELETLLDQDPSDRMESEIRFNLGLIAEERENYTTAQEWFESILEETEGESFRDEALFHLATVLEERGQIDAALEKVDRLEERIDDQSEDQEVVSRLRNRLKNQRKDRTDQLRNYDF